MPKKFNKVKIFEAGKFPQGEFNSERVADIFANTAEGVTAQFAHTSKVNKAKKDPLDLGKFSNFQLENDNIYADIEFNDKGQMYYEDGTINACSVEIANNEITRVAILPINEDPQILGAEFAETGAMTFGGEMEFAEEFSMSPSEVVEGLNALDMSTVQESEFSAIQEAMWQKQDEKYAVSQLTKSGYTVTKSVSEFANMSTAEVEQAMRDKITAEFSAKSTGTEKFNKLKSEGKITPAMEKAGMTVEFMQSLQEGAPVEFGATTMAEFGKTLEGVIDAVPGLKGNSVVNKGLTPNDGTGDDKIVSPSGQLKGLKL